MNVLVVLLSCVVAVLTAENVTIADGDTLKQYLCPSNGTLPPNTNLVLSKPQLNISHTGELLFCLIENTTNISILPSQEVLSGSTGYVTVNCHVDYYTGFGFGFFNVTDLTIRSVVFMDCMAPVSPEAAKFVNETSQFLYYKLNRVYVSLFLSHCNNVRLYNVSAGVLGAGISHDPGFIIGVNLCGFSEIITLVPDGGSLFYPLSRMLVYFTDSNVTSPRCNVSITSNILASTLSVASILDKFRNDTQRMPITYFGDFVLFLTQSFVVNVTLSIGSRRKMIEPTHTYNYYIAIVFIDSHTSSQVSFQQFGHPYQSCLNGDPVNSKEKRALILEVVFFETPSFNAASTDSNILSPLLIKNTAFINNGNSDYFGAILNVVKISGQLFHEVQLDNVSWCGNDLTNVKQQPIPLLNAQNLAKDIPGTGHLYLKLNNLLMRQNFFGDDFYLYKTSQCLLCFANISEVAMTGTNTFTDNAGGTVMNVVSSNLSVSGNLIIKDGYAYEGGAIRLDGASTLYLKEPLMAEFSNNTADKGSAIYAPIQSSYDKASAIQIWPSRKYSDRNITSIDISLHFKNNSDNEMKRSFYAPHFSFFGKQTSPNLSFPAFTWDDHNSQYAYTTLIDTILYMEERDKFTSLSNGLCIQILWQKWECIYIDQSVRNADHSSSTPQCHDSGTVLYNIPIYPGQKAFSVLYTDNQVYDIGTCLAHKWINVDTFQPYRYTKSSLMRDNSTLAIQFQYYASAMSPNDSVDYYVALFTDNEVKLLSLPILRLEKKSCPLGFCLSNGTCSCDPGFKEQYSCNIDSRTFTSQPGYWTGFNEYYGQIFVSKHCPPNYCTKELKDFQLNDALNESSCLGHRTGVLCGECKENYSVVFGSDTCYSHCTDVYLLTLPVYALAGLLLVLVLFVLRVTVATGTINGVIFYANILGLVMEKLTERTSGYVSFVRVFFSLLNLDLGFPLCFYDGMTTAGKVGFQFVFPVYLWSIVVGLILLSKFSIRVSKLISTSSVQVLATLFYLSFSKLLRTVIVIFSHSSIDVIKFCSNTSTSRHVWYFDGNHYGNSTHAILLTLAVIFTLLFLLPYALVVTFSSCFVRFRVVNKFRPFIDAYGGPFKDKWRFWFGLHLWITILLFGLDGALEGTDSDAMFIVHIVIIMVFVMLQGFLRPFKNNLIGLLDASFMVNYWLLIEVYFTISSKSGSMYWAIYIFLTATAVVVVFLILLFHLCALKYRDSCMNMLHGLKHGRRGYRVIGRVQEGDSDVDLFRAAEERVPDTY